MEIDELLDDYDDVTNDLLSSNYQMFESRLAQYLSFLDETSEVKQLLDKQLPNVDFEPWYVHAKTTVKSMVGSGTLDWPTARLENLSIRLALLRYIHEGKEDIPNFCTKFMYSDNNFNAMVQDFGDQIIAPTARDIRKLIERDLRAESTMRELDPNKAPTFLEPGPVLVPHTPEMLEAFKGARSTLAQALATIEGQNEPSELGLTDEQLRIVLGHLAACSEMLKDHMLSRGLLNDTVNQISPLKDKLGLFAAIVNAFSAVIKFFI